jgi:hypothetical protein
MGNHSDSRAASDTSGKSSCPPGAEWGLPGSPESCRRSRRARRGWHADA